MKRKKGEDRKPSPGQGVQLQEGSDRLYSFKESSLDGISVEGFVTFDDSLVTSEEIADDFEEQMIRLLTQGPETIEVNSEACDKDNEPEDVVSPLMTWSQGTQAFLNLKRFLADYEFNDILNTLESVHQDIDRNTVCKQTKITQFLLDNKLLNTF